MNKLSLFVFAFLLISSACFAQINSSERSQLHKKEDSLKSFALQIIQGRTVAERFTADSQFTKMFVRALKIKNSNT